MPTYWYSTNGMDRRRLPDCHLPVLDQAFEQQTRVQFFDDAFGLVPVIANPFQGTMTAGELHYGLYRQPSLRQAIESSLDDALVFVEENTLDNTHASGVLGSSAKKSRKPSNGTSLDLSTTETLSRSITKTEYDCNASRPAHNPFTLYRFMHKRRQVPPVQQQQQQQQQQQHEQQSTGSSRPRTQRPSPTSVRASQEDHCHCCIVS